MGDVEADRHWHMDLRRIEVFVADDGLTGSL